jgi:hypothetical protein
MRLKERYEQMTQPQRLALAKAAGISDAGYLWQIANRWNGRKPSIALMVRLSQVDEKLTLEDMAAEFSAPAPSKADPADQKAAA